MKKSRKIFSIILLLSILGGTFAFIITNFDKNYYTLVRELRAESQTIIKEISNFSFRLSDLIAQTAENIEQDHIRYLEMHKLDEQSLEMIKKLGYFPENYRNSSKKIKDAVYLIRDSVLNYQIALNNIKSGNYIQAKERLKLINYSLNKATEHISRKDDLIVEFIKK